MQQTTKLGASLIILLIVNGIRLYQYVTEPHTVSSVSNDIKTKLSSRAIEQNAIIMGFNTDLPKFRSFIPIKANVKHDLGGYYQGDGSITIALIGNSYARSIMYVLKLILGKSFNKIRAFSNFYCNMTLHADDMDCNDYVRNMILELNELRPDIIFIEIVNADVLQTLIDMLITITKRIIIEYPIANRKYGTFNITSRIMRSLIKHEPLESMDIEYLDYYSYYKYAISIFDSVRCYKCDRIYLYKLFCNSKICRTYDRKTLTSYFDANIHLHRYTLNALQNFYRKVLNELYAKGYISHF
ncbi:unnamed protein product [Dracunculus medinensis]|uniref:SGNH domain-containing protein n=1 Tax=Dracunculus medinensis TaxID=318479 RepID=A0A0N4U8R9_DRAME|nr:unnamed protein product [Dracunculus medinensis]